VSYHIMDKITQTIPKDDIASNKINISQFEIHRQVSRNIFALLLDPARLE